MHINTEQCWEFIYLYYRWVLGLSLLSFSFPEFCKLSLLPSCDQHKYTNMPLAVIQADCGQSKWPLNMTIG